MSERERWAYEEVPGGRTLQQAIEQPQRERWAYEELQPGDVIEAGDQWQNSDGRWHALVLIPGASAQVRDDIRARRPHNITRMLTEFASQAEVLAEVRADEKRLFDDLELLRSEYAKLQRERDEARAALKSAQRARDELQLQVDELRAGLMGVVSAEHVHSMLEDMLDQTEWVGQCLDSSTYEQMSCIQRTISVIAQRVNDMRKEDTSADT